jgi:hypothetical protein
MEGSLFNFLRTLYEQGEASYHVLNVCEIYLHEKISTFTYCVIVTLCETVSPHIICSYHSLFSLLFCLPLSLSLSLSLF